MFLQVLYKLAVITCFANAFSNNEALLTKLASVASSPSAFAFGPESIPAGKRFLAQQVKLDEMEALKKVGTLACASSMILITSIPDRWHAPSIADNNAGY